MTKILVIDDEEISRKIICRYLEDSGYETLSASNGNEGLLLVEQQKIDVVVTDIFMPEKDGLETIQELRKKQPNIKIVALSTFPAGALAMADLAGAHQTLSKPILKDDLLHCVESALQVNC